MCITCGQRRRAGIGAGLLVAAVYAITACAEPVVLFDGTDLGQFYTFIKERGRDVDPNKVFAIQDGLLRISGEEWGALITRDEYERYHLTAEFKWGDATHKPRKKKTRDSGILLHSVGEDGVHGGSWKRSIECQMMEGSTGDFIVIGDGTDAFSITCRVGPVPHEKGYVFHPDGQLVTVYKGRVYWRHRDPNWRDETGFRGAQDVERPLGEWNRLECICDGTTITVVLNGEVVNQATNVRPSKGRIQIQSEGAELFFRSIVLTPLGETRKADAEAPAEGGKP